MKTSTYLFAISYLGSILGEAKAATSHLNTIAFACSGNTDYVAAINKKGICIYDLLETPSDIYYQLIGYCETHDIDQLDHDTLYELTPVNED